MDWPFCVRSWEQRVGWLRLGCQMWPSETAWFLSPSKMANLIWVSPPWGWKDRVEPGGLRHTTHFNGCLQSWSQGCRQQELLWRQEEPGRILLSGSQGFRTDEDGGRVSCVRWGEAVSLAGWGAGSMTHREGRGHEEQGLGMGRLAGGRQKQECCYT